MRARFCVRVFVCAISARLQFVHVRCGRVSVRGESKKIRHEIENLLYSSDKSSTFAPNFKKTPTMYRDPTCYVSDLEEMIGKSYTTAKRLMAKIRKHYHMSNREKPTIQQVKEYLEQF